MIISISIIMIIIPLHLSWCDMRADMELPERFAGERQLAPRPRLGRRLGVMMMMMMMVMMMMSMMMMLMLMTVSMVGCRHIGAWPVWPFLSSPVLSG